MDETSKARYTVSAVHTGQRTEMRSKTKMKY